MDLDHIPEFTHRHFSSAGHNFLLGNTSLYIDAVTADIAVEAGQHAFIHTYTTKHGATSAAPICSPITSRSSNKCTGKSRWTSHRDLDRVMPKHFRVDQQYKSSGDSGVYPVP